MTSQQLGDLLAMSGQPRIGPAIKTGPKAAMFARGRMKSGEMNKTEAAYRDHLELLKHAGEIQWYLFEAVTLKLAKDTRYTPDFVVLTKEGLLEFREVKGFWQDDARVKIKVAAAMFPFRFVAIKQVKGSWIEEEF